MESTVITMLQRRVDKAIIDVIFEMQHAAYYLFDEGEKNWKKGDIEGPLLLVKRSQEPYFYVTILNKQTLSNFHQPISMDAQFDKKMPQLLYIKDRNKGVYGIWSPSADQLDSLLIKLGEIQHIDSQSRMLKSLLDIGGESNLMVNSRSPDSISEPKQQEYRETTVIKAPEENVMKPEFFQKGIQFEDEEVSNSRKERLREAIIALANSDEFLDLVMQALRSKGFN
ncbi:unnamed protein product [Blepharisma stoltei]|uniref:Uncharacterized protein n=1 Tax=Blepharisma stoltei TaxID=1481888 RepID=A0AAU9I6B5_9CILI|nr:unnamed protein product [Blepharisma stoltei]